MTPERKEELRRLSNGVDHYWSQVVIELLFENDALEANLELNGKVCDGWISTALEHRTEIKNLEAQLAHCKANHSEPFACHCQAEGGWLCEFFKRTIELEAQQRLLAEGIVKLCESLGSGTMGPLTGPQLLMVAKDGTLVAKELLAQRDRLDRLVRRLSQSGVHFTKDWPDDERTELERIVGK